MNLLSQLQASKKSAKRLAVSSTNQRNKALLAIIRNLQNNANHILKANDKDIAKKRSNDPTLDRLILTKERLNEVCEGIQTIVDLPDPLNIELDHHQGPSKIELKKITVPLGTIGIIYESRPNVTADISALCLKSGNTVLLRGGSDAYGTNSLLTKVIQQALAEVDLPKECVQLLKPERELVKELLTSNEFIDLIIPRGSKELIQMVRKTSTIPTIETGASVVHTYVDDEAELIKSVQLVINEKMRRPSVCNALDTLLLHKKIAKKFLTLLAETFKHQNPIPEIRADNIAYTILKTLNYPKLKKAKPEDYSTEFLDYIMNCKLVGSIDEAIEHIQTYSLKHSESICTDNPEKAKRFQNEVDAACVFWNTSTGFADGYEFGLGGEIGISTQKMHARGPMGLKELTSYKWLIDSDYLIRPTT